MVRRGFPENKPRRSEIARFTRIAKAAGIKAE
jgi:hypothetical protein